MVINRRQYNYKLIKIFENLSVYMASVVMTFQAPLFWKSRMTFLLISFTLSLRMTETHLILYS